jgi:hypothetical protein
VFSNVVARGHIEATSGKFTGDINVGSYAGYAWPASGGTGAHLSSSGLLLGNANDGKYFQVTADGNLYAPGISIENGNATFAGTLTANVQTFVAGNEWMLGASISSTNVSTSGMQTTSSYTVNVSQGKTYVAQVMSARWMYWLSWGLWTASQNTPGNATVLLTVAVEGFTDGTKRLCAIAVPIDEVRQIYDKGTITDPTYNTLFTNAELLGDRRVFPISGGNIYSTLCSGVASGTSLTVRWYLTFLSSAAGANELVKWRAGNITHPASPSVMWKTYANRGSELVGGGYHDYMGIDADVFITQYAAA